MRLWWWKLMSKVKYFFCCKLKFCRRKNKNKSFDQATFMSLVKGTAMEVVVDCVGKTNSRERFKEKMNYNHNKNVCFSSDYGGENNQSSYNTYTFTFFSYSTLQEWRKQVRTLKKAKGYSDDAPQYKTTKAKSRTGKIGDWLATTQSSFDGLIVSFAVDKKIDSMFAPTPEDLLNEAKKINYAQGSFYEC